MPVRSAVPGLLAAVTLLAAIAVACSSDQPPPEATSAGTATASPTAGPTSTPDATSTADATSAAATPTRPRLDAPAGVTPVPFPVLSRAEANERRTGVAEIDAVIDALLSGDQAAIDAFVEPRMVACLEVIESLDGPPQCRAGEPDGTIVEVFSVAGCHSGWKHDRPFVPAFNPLETSLATVIPMHSDTGPTVLVIFESRRDRSDRFEQFRHNFGAPYYWVSEGRILGSGGGCNSVESLFEWRSGDPLIWPVSFPDLMPPGDMPPPLTPTPERSPVPGSY